MAKDDTLIEKLRKIFVTQEIFDLKFDPVQKIVYGFVGIILLAVVTYIVSLAVKTPIQ